MMYKGLLLDIDNTLYPYNNSHEVGLNAAFSLIESQFGVESARIKNAFSEARREVNITLSETAASHNRMLYFQKMLERLDLPSTSFTLEIYEAYWDNFLNEMTAFNGVYEMLEKYKSRICLVTDLTAHIQHRKIKKLRLDKYVDLVLTSEEAGHEKPHPIMFNLSLEKLKCSKDEVCMIGDSFKKDILGASRLGIQSIWLNSSGSTEEHNSPLINEVNSFEKILKLV
jgi:HAD superfamily hydrolase (TIGR01549 family)